MILYEESLMKSTKQNKTPLLELRSEFSNVVGYNNNTQISILFLYTSNKQSKFKF